MDNQEKTKMSKTNGKPKYEPPSVRVMDESEVLTASRSLLLERTMWWFLE